MTNPISSYGSYTGNGSSQSVTLGYRPAFVRIWNESDDNTSAEHIYGMADGAAFVMDTEVSEETDCITLAANGFSVGSHDAVNESGDTFRYVAVRY